MTFSDFLVAQISECEILYTRSLASIHVFLTYGGHCMTNLWPAVINQYIHVFHFNSNIFAPIISDMDL